MHLLEVGLACWVQSKMYENMQKVRVVLAWNRPRDLGEMGYINNLTMVIYLYINSIWIFMSINVYVLSQHSTIHIVPYTNHMRNQCDSDINAQFLNLDSQLVRKANTEYLVCFSLSFHWYIFSFLFLFVLSSVYLWYVLCAAWACLHSLYKAPRSSLTSTNVAILEVLRSPILPSCNFCGVQYYNLWKCWTGWLVVVVWGGWLDDF